MFLFVVLALGLGLRAAPALAQNTPTLAPADGGTEPALDRQTPRRTLEGFLRQAKDGDFLVAASYLDLRTIPADSRDQEGPELARKLAYVLERQKDFDTARISDEPEGDATSHGSYVAGRLYVGEELVPIVLERERFPDGLERWLIGEPTVSRIPRISAVSGPGR
ncbi:MAG TPA: hypothetical protein VH044_07055, partial [Polyangiaceae bacterium]|nr:hypothetical protein [Polyangiaceae bacterium]